MLFCRLQKKRNAQEAQLKLIIRSLPVWQLLLAQCPIGHLPQCQLLLWTSALKLRSYRCFPLVLTLPWDGQPGQFSLTACLA